MNPGFLHRPASAEQAGLMSRQFENHHGAAFIKMVQVVAIQGQRVPAPQAKKK